MEETKELIDGIEGWIESLKENPDNDSPTGLFEYLSDGCNVIISLNHADLIWDLHVIYRVLVGQSGYNWTDYKLSLEKLIDFAPIVIENADELKLKREKENLEEVELRKLNHDLDKFTEDYYKDTL